MLTITEQDVRWRDFDLAKLSDELAAAGLPRPMRSERNLDTATLYAAFDADEADRDAILAVIEAHDPDAPSQAELDAQASQAEQEAMLDVVRARAAEDPAFAALAALLGVTLD